MPVGGASLICWYYASNACRYEISTNWASSSHWHSFHGLAVKNPFIATLGSFGCGTGIAWSSPVLPKIDPEQCKDHCDLSDVTTSLASWVGPLFPLGATCSGPVAFFMLNKLGRKKTLIGLSFPMLIGWILLTSSKALDSIVALLIGRFLIGKISKFFKLVIFIKTTFLGFSGGAYALVAPFYVSEISENSIRGALSSIMQLMATLGVCFVNGLNVNGALDWVAISAVCIAIPGN